MSNNDFSESEKTEMRELFGGILAYNHEGHPPRVTAIRLTDEQRAQIEKDIAERRNRK